VSSCSFRLYGNNCSYYYGRIERGCDLELVGADGPHYHLPYYHRLDTNNSLDRDKERRSSGDHAVVAGQAHHYT